MSRPQLRVVPANVITLPTAIPGQNGRPGWPEAAQRRTEQFRAAAVTKATCGHDNATVTVLTGAFRVNACPDCATAIAGRQDCYLTLDGPDGDDAA